MAKKVSPDKGKSVQSYIAKFPDWHSDAMNILHELVLKVIPDAKHSIKWAQPVYEQEGPFVFMKAAKNHVTFGFWRGVELNDPDGLLEGSGEKMRHIKVKSADGINTEQISKWIAEAAQLNSEKGDPSR